VLVLGMGRSRLHRDEGPSLFYGSTTHRGRPRAS
jgi:hypothetical protein